ncbi:MAG: DsbA family protein [Candidatus Aenigmatarchaeota archaeon]|nr:MAG: DsbA family protein [Candidatus Aenigmarchaeota archaeon]
MKLEFKILYGLLAVAAVLFFMLAGRPGTGNYVKISEYNPVLGQEDAPVTFSVFGDYKCSYTKQLFEEVLPQLKESYIDTGKVKLVYKHLVAHEESKIAAEASLCAHDQGKFWPFVSIILENTEEWSQGGNITFDKYANELGLDENAFSDCLDQHSHRIHVEKDYDEGKELGVSGTPTFFINGMKIEGLIALEKFKDVLSKFTYS